MPREQAETDLRQGLRQIYHEKDDLLAELCRIGREGGLAEGSCNLKKCMKV